MADLTTTNADVNGGQTGSSPQEGVRYKRTPLTHKRLRKCDTLLTSRPTLSTDAAPGWVGGAPHQDALLKAPTSNGAHQVGRDSHQIQREYCIVWKHLRSTRRARG